MSVHCDKCGAVASYGHEIGHRSDCPAIVADINHIRKMPIGERINRITNGMALRQADILETALRNLMAAYERRIRSDCKTPEELAKEPWRCVEYVAAERAIASVQEPDTVPCSLAAAARKAPRCTSTEIFDRQESHLVITRYSGVLR